jgi:hypothetical protein
MEQLAIYALEGRSEGPPLTHSQPPVLRTMPLARPDRELLLEYSAVGRINVDP